MQVAKSVVESLLSYNLWANSILISTLDDPFLQSKEVLRLFSHVMNAHQIWNSRMQAHASKLGVWDIHDLRTISDLNRNLHITSAQVLEGNEMGASYHYSNTSGKPFSGSIGDTMLHIVNHGTHHRGQILILIRQAGRVPPGLDYIFYRRDS